MRNVGMIFAHPGHELVSLGLIQRLRPRILYLTQADADPAGLDREQLATDCLDRLDLASAPTFLNMNEQASYAHAFAGDVEYFAGYCDAIADWLAMHQIDTVFTDAQEMYNFHHDLSHALTHSAIRAAEPSIDHFEIAVACRTSHDLFQLRYQEFPWGPYETCRLTLRELALKRRMTDWAGKRCQLIADTALLLPTHREVYRAVPMERDASIRPRGLRCHFEDWGKYQVSRGKYRQPLLFDRHFAPIVRGLEFAHSLPRAAA